VHRGRRKGGGTGKLGIWLHAKQTEAVGAWGTSMASFTTLTKKLDQAKQSPVLLIRLVCMASNPTSQLTNNLYVSCLDHEGVLDFTSRLARCLPELLGVIRGVVC